MPKSDKATEGSVFGKLKKRYPTPEWALFRAVQNSTGYRRSNEADAVAMGLWPSRGMEVHGIEIKVSRADWLRELRKPKKSEAIQKYCDRWWVAVSDKAFVDVDSGELPATWGLMAIKGAKLYTIVEAPKLEPQPLDRGFVAAVLRRAHESMQDPDIEAKIRGELEEEYKKRREGSHELYMLKKRNAELQATIDRHVEVAQLSGVRLSDWNYKDIAKAVGVVLNDGAPGLLRRLEQTWAVVDTLHGNLKEAMIELEEVAAIAKAENEPK